jgi:hypothetical protein
MKIVILSSAEEGVSQKLLGDRYRLRLVKPQRKGAIPIRVRQRENVHTGLKC